MRSPRHSPRSARIHGVDFSGAVDAGRKIWIASGVIQGGGLRIEECRRAEDLPGSGRERERCLAALRRFIAGEPDSAFGLDFPFGLPRALVREGTWEEFVRSFPERYRSPEEFRRACRRASAGAELRRVTDLESRTPFSPYNLRVYRQTYFGIRDLLHPLIVARRAAVPPVQRPLPGRAWILEICPASTLKRRRLYCSYKGRSRSHGAARARILRALEGAGALALSSGALRRIVLHDPGGDALDSVIAALGAFRALADPAGLAVGRNGAYALEGYVYA